MPSIVENSEWWWVFISGTVVLILLLVPFLWAYGLSLPDSTFTGVLVSPIDGVSYQAKMYQGLEGGWLFHLPYTPEQHQGVVLFVFYLGLGHLARLLNVPATLVFHTARLTGSMLMFLAFYRFIANYTDDVPQRRITWLLGVFGAGVGWIALLFRHVSPDLLMLPEAFPLQAAYANAHFPWALACALLVAHILLSKWLAETDDYPDLNVETAALAASTVILVSTSPFVLLPLSVGVAVLFIWIWQQRGQFPQRQFAWGLVVFLFGLPLAAYNAWAISRANPVFHAWMQQNVTPSPPVWDYLIAFGPMLALALVAIWVSRRLLQPRDLFLLGWLLSAGVLLYAPLGLQRRFAMGLMFPLAIYAGRGLWRVVLPRVAEQWKVFGVALAFTTFLPTTIIAVVLPMMTSLSLSQQGGGPYFVQRGELQAMAWLEARDPGALVLASPETSLFLPVYGLRVVYGHPFETLHAERRRQSVEAFYRGWDCSVVENEGVEYILVGPREHRLSPGEICPVGGEIAFESSDGKVALYVARGG